MKATSWAFVLAALLLNVAGQNASAQSNDPWSGSRTSPTTGGDNRQYDQRGATIGAQPNQTAEIDPWTMEDAQQAATNAGNSLRNSVNSGTQQLNQQGQQVIDSAQNAGRDFGQQLQNMAGFNGQPSQPAAPAAGSGSSASSWSAPPLNTATNTAITPQAWSSIRPELAPPRLATPRLASNPASPRATTGPGFPAPALATDTTHSVLAPPPTTSTQAHDQDWSSIWGPSANSSTTTSSDESGLLPVPPRPRTSTSGMPPATTASNSNSMSAPPVDDRYRQQAPAPQLPGQGVDQWANFGQRPAAAFDPRPLSTPQQQAAAALPQNQSLPPIGQATIGTQPNAGQQATQATPADEVPWKPLLGVSLALAGSVGANFFLGMSYADARRRYRSLVAKTTHAFQKEAGIAA